MTTDPTIIPIIIPGAVPVVAHESGAGPTVREATPGRRAGDPRSSSRTTSQAGHLLPRTLDDVTARASPFRGRRERRGRRARRAPSWRRSAPASPRCGRSSSREDARGPAAGARHCRRAAPPRARRPVSRRCARSRTTRASSCGSGFSIVPHMWVPEKIAADCWSCPLFRKCGQYAVVDARLGRPITPVARAGAPVVTGRPMPAGVTIEPVEGGVTAPAGFRAAGVACGIKKAGALDLALVVVGRDRPAAPRRLHDQPGAGGARCSCRASTSRTSGGVARAVVVNSGCANACTGADGLAGRAEMPRTRRARRRVRGRAGAGRLDRRHRRAAGPRQGARGRRSTPRRRSSRDAPRRRRAGHHDDRPVPEGGGRVASRPPAGTFRVGGMAKGSGMIEPIMATMLGFVTTDAAVAARRCCSGRSREAVDDTFNAITVDGECSTNDSRVPAGQRRERRRDRRGGATRRSSPALRAVCRDARARRSSAAARARPSWSPSRVDRRASSDADARARRAGDRELAAREDRHPRRRPELGPARGRGGPRGRGVRSRARRRPSRPRRALRGRRPFDERAPEAAAYLQGPISRSTSTSAPAAPHSRHRVDVRPERGVRGDQRGVSDVVRSKKPEGPTDDRQKHRSGVELSAEGRLLLTTGFWLLASCFWLLLLASVSRYLRFP